MNSNRILLYCMLVSTGILITNTISHCQVNTSMPNELEFLIAGWEDNTSRIMSLEANASLSIEDKRYENCIDLDGNRFNQKSASIQLWKTNEKLRADVTFNRTFDFSNGKVNYHIPYGKYITNKGLSNQENLLKTHGVTKATNRILINNQECHWYLAESRGLLINPASLTPPIDQECLVFANNKLIHGKTFLEKIQSSLQHEHNLEVEKLGEGLYKIISSKAYGKPPNEILGKTEIVINSQQGCTIQKIRCFTGKELDFKGDYEYANVNGIWILHKAETAFYDLENGGIERKTTLNVDKETIKINKDISPEKFSVDSLALEDGALVRNNITGERHLYNDVPLHLKVAVTKALENIETLQDDIFQFDKKEQINTKDNNFELKDVKSQEVILKNTKDIGTDKRSKTSLNQGSAITIKTWLLLVCIVIIIISFLIYRRRGTNK